MDTIDLLQETALKLEEMQIKAARIKVVTDNPSGQCWHCGEDTGKKRRWCDAYCCKRWDENANGR